MLEDDPDKINDPNRELENKVFKQAEGYQASRVRSQKENKVKAEGRKEIDKLGFRTDAYQAALRVARDLTPAEQKQYVRDFRFFLKVFGSKQMELWPEDAAKAEARAKRKAERRAKAIASAGGETPEAQLRRVNADSNPRNNPDNGGAGKAKRAPRKAKPVAESVADRAEDTADRNQRLQETKDASPGAQPAETGDELIARVAAEKNAELEQKEGAALLDTTPKSQSAQAAEVRQKLGLE